MESIQKANKAGPEKDKGEAEKGQEKLSGAETRNEKGEEETNAGNIPEHLRTVPSLVWACRNPLLGARDVGRWLLGSWWRDQHLQALLCCSARSGKGLDVEGSEGRGQTSSPRPGSGGLHAGFWPRRAPPCQPELWSRDGGMWRCPWTLAQALAWGVVAGIFHPRSQVPAWGHPGDAARAFREELTGKIHPDGASRLGEWSFLAAVGVRPVLGSPQARLHVQGHPVAMGPQPARGSKSLSLSLPSLQTCRVL